MANPESNWLETISSVGTFAAAVFAAYGTWLAKGAADASKESAGAALEQARIAEKTRQQSISPTVVVYAHTPLENSESIYFYVRNVGNGVALDVKLKLIEGHDFIYADSHPLTTWAPFEKGISILPPNTAFNTLLLKVRGKEEQDLIKNNRITVRVDCSDIEGGVHTRSFENIELLPESGRRWVTSTRRINGKLVEEKLERPDED